jgi:hypothetical protein
MEVKRMHLEIRNNEVYLNGVKQGKLGHIQLEIDITFEQERVKNERT